MKFFLLIIIVIPLFHLTFCQTSIPDIKSDSVNYQIARWYDFKDAAVSITFDDGVRSQFTIALPLLNERSLKATFYVVTNYIGTGFTPDWDTLNIVALEGHEIGSHSMNHPNMAYLASNPEFADSLNKELLFSRDLINLKIPSQRCETFCWPGGSVNPQAIAVAKKYYLSCRASGTIMNFSVVPDFYNVESLPIYHTTSLVTANYWVDEILNLKGWLIERIHGINSGANSEGYEPVPISILKNHWDYLVTHRKQLWIATFSTVTKYIRERDMTRLKPIDYQNGNFRMSLTNKLADSVYSVPLTLKIKLISKLNYFKEVQQNGKPLNYKIIRQDTVSYLVIDAIPNQGDINIYIPAEFIENHTDPYNSTTQITFDLTSCQKVKLCIYNSDGKIVKRYKKNFQSGLNSITFNSGKLLNGVYNYSLEIGNGYIYRGNLVVTQMVH
jgi:peptidoglycan/xylan/chitin deacetylase (PgdA/CDA1 family)